MDAAAKNKFHASSHARHWNLLCGLSVATTSALAIDGYLEKNSRQLSKLEYEIGPDERSEPNTAILGIKA